MNRAENSFHTPIIHKDYHFTQLNTLYLRIEEALRLRASTLACLASVTRLARIAAYSFYEILLAGVMYEEKIDRVTYSSFLGALRVATLECESMTLVLETLRSNQTLDLWCLGVDLLALTLWLNLTTDNEFTDLTQIYQHFALDLLLTLYPQAPARSG